MKRRETAMEENEKKLSERLSGLKVTFGSFAAEVTDTMAIKVSAINGWSVTYPALSTTWGFLGNWMLGWDNPEYVACMENFIKIVVYPMSNRLSDIDREYLDDAVAMHTRLNERMLANAHTPTQEEESQTIGELKALYSELEKHKQ